MSSPAVQLRSRVSTLGGAAVEKARLTVVPVSRGRAPRVPFIVLVSVVALAGVVGLLLFNTSLQQASFAETRLADKAAALADREETLRMELDDLRDPQRIAREAESMGMVIPPAPAFLKLDGTVVGTPRPATPEDRIRITPRPPAMPADLQPEITVIEVPAKPAGE
ncbi:cell division protein FtsL [Nocardioides daphniae]|uniref:cell division protein FtsL n=1 Tax=Nocardioides daphniae TaxID=402297 RepID=UPI0016646407|nr:cell division protein FtsL [Nocardioides daphniae]